MRWFDRIASAALSVGGWTYVVITILICLDIVMRRLIGVSTGATTELSGYLMAVGMAWGLAGTLHERAHVRIDVLVQKLPLAARAWLHVTSLLVLAIVAGFFTWGAVALAHDSWMLGATDLSTLQMPLALPQALWAGGVALLLLACVVFLARSAVHLYTRSYQQVEHALLARGYVEEAEETLEALTDAGGTPAHAGP